MKGIHREVHRTKFVRLNQKQGQSMNAYYGSLKAEASLCDFRVASPTTCADTACTCANHGIQVDYTHDMVATQLVAGLHNSDHQVKVLSESTALTTLDAKFKRLLVLESSESSLSSLANNEALSNYTGGPYYKGPGGGNGKPSDNQRRRDKWNKKDKETDDKPRDKCSDCGKQHAQCKSCNGFHKCTTRCNFCRKTGHIKNCCMKMLRQSAAAAAVQAGDRDGTPLIDEVVGNDEEEVVVFGYKVTVEEKLSSNRLVDRSTRPRQIPSHKSLHVFAHQLSTYLLSHMESKDGSFHATKPAKAPLIEVSCTILAENHLFHGKQLCQGKRRRVITSGLADTGAQVCTAGPGLLSYFHIDEEFLVPTKLVVKGIAHFPVTILGALFLKVCAGGMCTEQIVYIAREARSFILSETALKELGVLPEDFPVAASFKGTTKVMVRQDDDAPTPGLSAMSAVSGVTKNVCGCPARARMSHLSQSTFQLRSLSQIDLGFISGFYITTRPPHSTFARISLSPQ